jgi:hypothetical protein
MRALLTLAAAISIIAATAITIVADADWRIFGTACFVWGLALTAAATRKSPTYPS